MLQRAIFGGQFSPPHTGHRKAIDVVIDAFAMDNNFQVDIVPTWHQPLKQEITPFNHRMAMCELMFSGVGNVVVSDVEQREGIENTFALVECYLQQFSRDQIVFVIGSDNMMHFHEWHRAEELGRMVNLFAVPDSGVHSISIREMLQGLPMKRKEVNEVLGLPVVDYIIDNWLYYTGAH